MRRSPITQRCARSSPDGRCVKKLLSRLFGGRDEALSRSTPLPARSTLRPPELVLRIDATVPIVDWEAMERFAPDSGTPAVLDEYWTVTAKSWLETLGACLAAATRSASRNAFSY